MQIDPVFSMVTATINPVLMSTASEYFWSDIFNVIQKSYRVQCQPSAYGVLFTGTLSQIISAGEILEHHRKKHLPNMNHPNIFNQNGTNLNQGDMNFYQQGTAVNHAGMNVNQSNLQSNQNFDRSDMSLKQSATSFNQSDTNFHQMDTAVSYASTNVNQSGLQFNQSFYQSDMPLNQSGTLFNESALSFTQRPAGPNQYSQSFHHHGLNSSMGTPPRQGGSVSSGQIMFKGPEMASYQPNFNHTTANSHTGELEFVSYNQNPQHSGNFNQSSLPRQPEFVPTTTIFQPGYPTHTSRSPYVDETVSSSLHDQTKSISSTVNALSSLSKTPIASRPENLPNGFTSVQPPATNQGCRTPNQLTGHESSTMPSNQFPARSPDGTTVHYQQPVNHQNRTALNPSFARGTLMTSSNNPPKLPPNELADLGKEKSPDLTNSTIIPRATGGDQPGIVPKPNIVTENVVNPEEQTGTPSHKKPSSLASTQQDLPDPNINYRQLRSDQLQQGTTSNTTASNPTNTITTTTNTTNTNTTTSNSRNSSYATTNITTSNSTNSSSATTNITTSNSTNSSSATTNTTTSNGTNSCSGTTNTTTSNSTNSSSATTNTTTSNGTNSSSATTNTTTSNSTNSSSATINTTTSNGTNSSSATTNTTTSNSTNPRSATTNTTISNTSNSSFATSTSVGLQNSTTTENQVELPTTSTPGSVNENPHKPVEQASKSRPQYNQQQMNSDQPNLTSEIQDSETCAETFLSVSNAGEEPHLMSDSELNSNDKPQRKTPIPTPRKNKPVTGERRQNAANFSAGKVTQARQGSPSPTEPNNSSENDKLSPAVKQDKESEQNLTTQNSETEINEPILDELD